MLGCPETWNLLTCHKAVLLSKAGILGDFCEHQHLAVHSLVSGYRTSGESKNGPWIRFALVLKWNLSWWYYCGNNKIFSHILK